MQSCSIISCKNCLTIPQYMELQDGIRFFDDEPKVLQSYPVLHDITFDHDRYCFSVYKLRQCPDCGTIYQYYYHEDSEDSMAAGADVTYEYARLNMPVYYDLLKSKKENEPLLNKIDALYKPYMTTLINAFKNVESLPENIKMYVITSIIDYHVLAKKWASLRNLLFTDKNDELKVTSAYYLTYEGWPLDSVYHSMISKDRRIFTNKLKKAGHEMFKKNRAELKNLLKGSLEKVKNRRAKWVKKKL